MEVPLLVGDFLRRAAKLYPDKTAIVDGDRALHLPRVRRSASNQLGARAARPRRQAGRPRLHPEPELALLPRELTTA